MISAVISAQAFLTLRVRMQTLSGMVIVMLLVGCDGRVVIFDFQTELIHLTQCSLKTCPLSHTALPDSLRLYTVRLK